MEKVKPNEKLPRCTNTTRTVYGCTSAYGILAWVDSFGKVTFVNFASLAKATRICKRLYNVTRIPHQVLYETVERTAKEQKSIAMKKKIRDHRYYEKRRRLKSKEKKHGTDQ